MASQTREKIVTAAADRLHALGYSACGIQEITDTAGVPKGSFYNYFKTKESLAIEVLGNYVASSKREILDDPSLSPLERIRAHFQFFIDRYQRNGFEKGCLIGNFSAESSDSTPLLREALAESLSIWTEQIAGVIRQGQDAGEIKPGIDPFEVARFLINSWEGAVLRMKLTNSRRALDDFFSIVMTLLEKA